jgi:hypothetical protein
VTEDNDTDILIFVEDPGAANCIISLPEALNARGQSCRLFAVDAGRTQLIQRGVCTETVSPSVSAKDLIDSVRPRTIVIGTSENERSLGLDLITRARDRNITTVGLVDGPANYSYRFRGTTNDPLAFAPDYVLVPEKETAKLVGGLGFPKSRIQIIGHPLYDQLFFERRRLQQIGQAEMRARKFPNTPATVPIVAFLTEVSTGLSPSQFFRSSQYQLHGRGISDLRTHIVLEEFLDGIAELKVPPYVILRLHPKDSLNEYSRFFPEVNQISQYGSAWDLLFACDFVVGMTTHLLFEAALLGVPTLSVVPRTEEQDWLVAISLGLTPCVSQRKSLRAALRRACRVRMDNRPPSLNFNLEFGATEKIAAFLLTIEQNPPA